MFHRTMILAATMVCMLTGAACGTSVNKSHSIPAGSTEAEGRSTVNGSISVGDGATFSSGDLKTVNGSVTVGANCKVNELKSVNGRIEIGSGTTAGGLKTTNGAISIGSEATAAAARTTNGAITLDAGSHLTGDAETTNGSVNAGSGATIDGFVETTNGTISLDGATVGKDITNTNGGMHLTNGAHVKGNLLVREVTGKTTRNDPPIVVIGKGCRVDGSLTFKREVELYIHDSAQVGEIIGATATAYSTDDPPKAP